MAQNWTNAAVVAVGFVVGCGGTGTTVWPGQGGSGAGGSTGTGTTVPGGNPDAGLPCDVESLLAANCQTCHSSPPVGGAPMALMTRADLLATSVTHPSDSEGQLSVTRMQATTLPMPPAGALPASSIAVFAAWVSQGMPVGSCGTTSTGPTNVFGGATVCTSGSYAPSGGDGSSVMRPGIPCLSCHAGASEAPQFQVAGTVYPTGHEPNNCNGSNGTAPNVATATVVITDANNRQTTISVNGAGNFYKAAASAAIALPYTAKVVYNGKERAMATPQQSGDCNFCHTVAGVSGAPGRIALP